MKSCFAAGMTSYLNERQVRIFDSRRFSEPIRDRLRENAERLAAEAGIEIEFNRKGTFSKEKRVKEVPARGGEHPVLAAILSAMEFCSSDKPWHDKQTGKTFLKPNSGEPALLLLLHEQGTGPLLRAGANLVALPAANLLQRAQLAGR